MNKEVHYQMSQKQLARYVTISRLIEDHLTIKEAANYLGLSTRQTLRLKKGVKFFLRNVADLWKNAELDLKQRFQI